MRDIEWCRHFLNEIFIMNTNVYCSLSIFIGGLYYFLPHDTMVALYD